MKSGRLLRRYLLVSVHLDLSWIYQITNCECRKCIRIVFCWKINLGLNGKGLILPTEKVGEKKNTP